MQAHQRFSGLPATDQVSRQLLDGIGLLLLRVAGGGFMLPHGLGKLFGWFGGPGLNGFAAELMGFGLSAFPPLPLLLALAQTVLGAMVVMGAWTRWSALYASLFLAMTVVLSASHGWFWMSHGMECPLLWTLMLFALALTGAGPFSADHYLGHRLREVDEGIPP